MPTEHSGSVVYFVGATRGPIKIGVAKDLKSRLRHLQTGSGLKLTVLATVPGSFALERHYHRMFDAYRDHGEWFRRHPALIAEIKRLQKLDLPAFESEAQIRERERLRGEWAAAVERRNRFKGVA